MKPIVRWIAVLGCPFGSLLGTGTAMAQKSGGVLKIYHRDSPASMSILEEGTNSTEIPMMGVFNNLVMYDQHVAQNSLSSIVPDLATDWSTSEDGTQLTFHLHKGVKWHDGQPFTAKDVKCSWDLLTGKASEPLLDGIEYRIIPNRSTAVLAFIAGQFDMTFPYEVSIPLLKDIKTQAPHAICDLAPGNASTNLIVNRDKPPFDNPEIRRAMMLSLDRKAFIDILAEGQGDIGGAMQPPPAGIWGIPPELLKTVPGYDPDVGNNRAQARAIMEKLGYGPDNRLKLTVSARNIPIFRDPAIILIDQLKEIYVDGTLDPVETANWFPKVARKDYQIGQNNTGSGVDDPDQQFYENYACGSERNYTGYCNPELEKQFVQQSTEANQETRRQLVWEIDKKLQEDGARPIIYHFRAATCWQPQLKGLTIMVNSQYNGWRMEDWWLDR